MSHLDRDPETALRVLTAADGVIQDRVVTAIRRARGCSCHSDVFTGQAPDIESAAEIIRRLLRETG